MITVVTPPATKLLTTLVRVKAELGITDNTLDSLLYAKIAEVSDMISSFCGREFGRTTVTEKMYGPTTHELVLSRWPVVAVSNITSDGTVLTSGMWQLNGAAGTLWRLEDSVPSYWTCGYTLVTYTYGWLLPNDVGRDLPYDVEAAAVEQIKAEYYSYNRDPRLRSIDIPDVVARSYQIGSIGGAETGALMPDVARKLDRYVVMRIG